MHEGAIAGQSGVTAGRKWCVPRCWLADGTGLSPARQCVGTRTTGYPISTAVISQRSAELASA